MGDMAYAAKQAALLKRAYGNRFEVVWGSSLETMPESLEFGRGEWLELRLESLERQARAVSGTQQSHLVARTSG